MTEIKPATDEEVGEFFDLLTSFGLDTEDNDLARCSVCYGPWFRRADQILHADDCPIVTAPSIQARIEADRGEIARLKAELASREASGINPEEAR